MDSIDISILKLLKENSRASASDISKSVNLSIPAVSERIRKLEQAKVIEKYTAIINNAALGYRLLAFIFVNIDETSNVENFRSAIVKIDSVLECHHIAGQYDYILKVLVEDTAALEYFISKVLKNIKGVSGTNTVITLSTLKETMSV